MGTALCGGGFVLLGSKALCKHSDTCLTGLGNWQKRGQCAGLSTLTLVPWRGCALAGVRRAKLQQTKAEQDSDAAPISCESQVLSMQQDEPMCDTWAEVTTVVLSGPPYLGCCLVRV